MSFVGVISALLWPQRDRDFSQNCPPWRGWSCHISWGCRPASPCSSGSRGQRLSALSQECNNVFDRDFLDLRLSRKQPRIPAQPGQIFSLIQSWLPGKKSFLSAALHRVDLPSAGTCFGGKFKCRGDVLLHNWFKFPRPNICQRFADHFRARNLSFEGRAIT